MVPTFAINLPPSAILKDSFLPKLSLTFVNLLKVLCSSITPYLFIVKQYFFGAVYIPHQIPPCPSSFLPCNLFLPTNPILSSLSQCFFSKPNKSASV